MVSEQDEPGECELEVIDVIERPDLAEEWLVLATPLVVHIEADNIRRAIGDFSDIGRLAEAISLPYAYEPLQKGSA